MQCGAVCHKRLGQRPGDARNVVLPSVPGTGPRALARRLIPLCALATAVVLATVSPADAIPSPELIVGSLASLSQLGALLSALLGGGAAVAAGRSRGGRLSGRPMAAAAIGLGLLAVALGALNVHQWQSARDERQQRLSATLKRPSRLPGQPQLDPTLKELGPQQQASHPLGISAAEAEVLVPKARELGYEIIDIRETAEVEMGTFADARAIRYPDFLANRHDLEGRKALLICHNGNRSSETCQALKELGIDCRFIIGGLERWIAEGRSAGGFHRSSVLEARAVPDYPNNDRLLDTPEARALIENQAAVIVDVRYPGEFAAGHLPGAVNIPMRRMTTVEVEAAFERLPHRPVIVACYDRRSCFFGELAGLALWRKGRDFRGRYTLPWEYAPLTPPPPHVAAALAERNLGPWARAQRWLAREIDGWATAWGFFTVLIGLAAASRLAILPFAIKAERDQLVAARIAPEVRWLKVRLADDPVRRMRAMRQLYRRHGLTPAVNLVALLGLPILMLAGAALGDAAALGERSHPLFGSLAKPDPTLLLAAGAAALIGLYVDWALCTLGRHRLVTWLVLVPGLVAALAFLPAATNIYVAASAVLLLAQRALVSGVPLALHRRWRAWADRSREAMGVVALAAAGDRSDVGNKAARLGVMAQGGMPVPGGVVLTARFLSAWQAADESGRRRLGRLVTRSAGRGPYAVRSSGIAEDGAGASHAGVYESVTDVTRPGLAAAIDRVLASFESGRALSYGSGEPRGGGAVIVQHMIRGRHGGVLFTRAPDAPGLALVELVDGAAENLVSGRGKPLALRFGRHSGRPLGEEPAPLDLAPLLAIGRRLEDRFGAPQDIEWVSDGRRVWIVQSRDITADAAATPPAVLAEWDRALRLAARTGTTGGPSLARNEMCELLPRPTPASRSLIEALHASGGSVDLACRALGIAYDVEEDAPPLFPTLFGRLYHNAAEARRRAPRLTRLDTRRIVRQAADLEVRMRSDVLPAIEKRLVLPAVTDFDALDTATLARTAGEIADRFVTGTHVEAEVVNIVAEVVVGEARTALTKAGLEPSGFLARRGETREETLLDEAAQASPAERPALLVRGLGHRARIDYELAEPRFDEQPQVLSARLRGHIAQPAQSSPAAVPPGTLEPTLARLVGAAGRLQVLKEDAKHVALAELAVLRRVLLALDRRLGLGGRIFLLTIEEIAGIGPEDGPAARIVAGAREAEGKVVSEAALLPAVPTLEAIERRSWPQAERTTEAPRGVAGMRVAGTRRAKGRAFVVDERTADAGGALVGFEPGDVIVAPFVHPAWLAQVLAAAGVVAGSGGWLSHMAIVARERDVAMVVGVEAWDRIQPGATITLELDGTIRTQDPMARDGAATGLLEAAQ